MEQPADLITAAEPLYITSSAVMHLDRTLYSAALTPTALITPADVLPSWVTERESSETALWDSHDVVAEYSRLDYRPRCVR
jgi:hypothetical protein